MPTAKTVLPLIAAALIFAKPAMADPEADAARIVDLTLTEEVFAGAFAAQAPIIASALANDFRQMGVEVSDMDRFVAILTEEMTTLFTERMQQATIPFYIARFTPDQLADLRAFYESETGAALIEQTPALMQFGAETGAQVGGQIGTEIGPALAARLEAEGVQITEESSGMQRLLDALR